MGNVNRRTFVLGGLAIAGAAAVVPASQIRTRSVAGQTGPYPFQLGVASGEPAPDSVVLWTRLAPSPLNADGQGGMANADVTVDWQVSTNDRFTHAGRVRLGHRPLRRRALGARRRRRPRPGRRLLLPVPGPGPHLAGRAHPHRTGARHLRPRPGDGVRLVRALRVRLLHGLPADGRGQPRPGPAPGRLHLRGRRRVRRRTRSTSGAEIVSLADYRRRYAQYKSDPDLQAAHAAAPWLVVPDDHEVENNYASMVRADNSPGADRGPVDRPAHRRLPGLLREHAAAARLGADRQQHPAVPPGAVGAAWPPSTCSTPASSATTRPAATAGRSAPTPTWPAAASPARPRRRGCSTASASTTAPGTSWASRSSSPGSSTRPARPAWTPGTATAPPAAGIQQGWVQRGVRNPVVLTGDVHRGLGQRPQGRLRQPGLGDHRHRAGLHLDRLGRQRIRRDHDPERGDQPAPEVLLRPSRLRADHDRADPGPGRLPRGQPAVTEHGAPVTTVRSFVIHDGQPGLQSV